MKWSQEWWRYFFYSPGLDINIFGFKTWTKTVHCSYFYQAYLSSDVELHSERPLEGGGAGDDLNQLPGDDSLSGSVESDSQFVDHLT